MSVDASGGGEGDETERRPHIRPRIGVGRGGVFGLEADASHSMSKPRRPSRWLAGVTLAIASMAGVSVAALGAQSEELPSAEEVFADPVNEDTKAELEAEDALLQAIGEASPAEVPSDPENAGPPLDPQDLAFETGIFPDAEFPNSQFEFKNYWNGVVGGWNVTVYAGAYSKDESSAVAFVKLTDPQSVGSKFAGPFEAKIPGPLQIESFKGSVITLVGGEGDVVEFDAASLAFV